jgi:hypothetical protein
VLRSGASGTFAVFRCGKLRDRFSQIDMLSLDVWWRGENVLVDAGSYLYNGPPEWHAYFHRTESHNTVSLDGRDQMLHHRKFKNVHWTPARLLRFDASDAFALAEGEHGGYRRYPGRCVHRRAVLWTRGGLGVVVDTVLGAGRHRARLHWLAGEYPWHHEVGVGACVLETPAGPFRIMVLDEEGHPAPGDVAQGQTAPIRGWMSRHYAERVAVPSFAITRDAELPITWVTLLCSAPPTVAVERGRWDVEADGERVAFVLRDGRFDAVSLRDAGASEGRS